MGHYTPMRATLAINQHCCLMLDVAKHVVTTRWMMVFPAMDIDYGRSRCVATTAANRAKRAPVSYTHLRAHETR
eukprot:6696432-Prorocentrum_lima.AAC.1